MSEGSEEKEINTKFKIKMNDLVNLVEEYRNRKFDEDLKMLKDTFGGVEGIAEKLFSSTTDGIMGDDLDERDLAFGSNAKDPPVRTGF